MKNLFLSAPNDGNWAVILIYVIIGLCVLLITGFILAGVLKNKDEAYYIKKNPSTLSITIDLKNEIVDIFSKKRLIGVTRMTLGEYLKFFKGKSRDDVEALLGKIKCNITDEIPNVLETNCLHSTNNKRVYFSVLNINSINLERSIVHFTQYFYNNIPVLYGIDLKRENKIKAMFNVPENVIKARMINSATKGAAILFHYTISTSYKNTDISALIYYALVNILSKYINFNLVLVQEKDSDLILFDFKTYQRHKFYKLINKIKKEFDKFIEMNGATNRIKFSIAVCENKFYPRDYHKIMKALHQTSVEASAKSRDFLFYENQTREEYYFDQSYRSEVTTIVENHSLKYYFMPIINTKNCNIKGYFSKVVPISKVFNDINEVKNYAYKLSYDKNLFSEISKHLLSKFINEAGNSKDITYLFYNLKYHEINYANSLLGYIMASKRANLVLTFNELDLLKHIDKNEDCTEAFRKLISKGYRLSLEVTLKTLELPDELYSLFDYFQFDIKYFDENFDDISHSSLTLKRSIEKILKYKKRVVVSSVNSWSDMELRIQENLRYLAGDVISPFSEMILPINKKVTDRIKKIKKRG